MVGHFKISNEGKAFTAGHELRVEDIRSGYFAPYLDSGGTPTMGVGSIYRGDENAPRVTMNDGIISLAEGMNWYAAEYENKAAYMRRIITQAAGENNKFHLTQSQFDALVDLAYHGFKKGTTGNDIVNAWSAYCTNPNDPQLLDAFDQLLRGKDSNQGLRNRGEDRSQLFYNGNYQAQAAGIGFEAAFNTLNNNLHSNLPILTLSGLSLVVPVDHVNIATLPDGLLYGADRAYRGGTHEGNDLPASTGTPVRALADGEIVRIVDERKHPGYAGNYVVIKHTAGNGDNYFSKYMHLSAYGNIQVPPIANAEGYLDKPIRVNAGDVIGNVGSSGTRESGAHLHFEVRKGTEMGPSIDPNPDLCVAYAKQHGLRPDMMLASRSGYHPRMAVGQENRFFSHHDGNAVVKEPGTFARILATAKGEATLTKFAGAHLEAAEISPSKLLKQTAPQAVITATAVNSGNTITQIHNYLLTTDEYGKQHLIELGATAKQNKAAEASLKGTLLGLRGQGFKIAARNISGFVARCANADKILASRNYAGGANMHTLFNYTTKQIVHEAQAAKTQWAIKQNQKQVMQAAYLLLNKASGIRAKRVMIDGQPGLYVYKGKESSAVKMLIKFDDISSAESNGYRIKLPQPAKGKKQIPAQLEYIVCEVAKNVGGLKGIEIHKSFKPNLGKKLVDNPAVAKLSSPAKNYVHGLAAIADRIPALSVQKRKTPPELSQKGVVFNDQKASPSLKTSGLEVLYALAGNPSTLQKPIQVSMTNKINLSPLNSR